jgi:hypothetical protein
MLAKVSEVLEKVSGSACKSQSEVLQKLTEVSEFEISRLATVKISGLGVSELTKKSKRLAN